MTAPLIGALAPVLAIVDGHATTLSTNVAELFGKRHADVLRAAELLRSQVPEHAQRNFALSDYLDSTGRTLPAYRLTRDGFTLLAMGFTGSKALQFKLAYIDAFNRMEAELQRRATSGPLDRAKGLIDIFAAAHAHARSTGLSERLAVGLAAGAVAEATGYNLLAAGRLSLRDLAPARQEPRRQAGDQLPRMLRTIGQARSYAGDRRYGHLLAQGAMPYGKLLALMKMPTKALRELCEVAQEAGQIRATANGYVLAGGAA